MDYPSSPTRLVTEVLRLDPNQPDQLSLARAGERLQAGRLVAFPTETVYGLGTNALDEEAVRRLFEAKQRPDFDPLIVHVATVDAIAPLVSKCPPIVVVLAERFWPGPLTLVLPRSPVVPTAVTAGLDTVALRIPSNPISLALLREAAVPVAAPSANLFSHPSPTTASHVLDDLDGRIDMVVDAGPTTIGLESTVVDLASDIPRILRPGAVSPMHLREVLPTIAPHVSRQPTDSPAPSPGLLLRHYAPTAPLTLYAGTPQRTLAQIYKDTQMATARGERIGVLTSNDDIVRLADLSAVVVGFGPDGNLEQIAARLYAALRELDRSSLDAILARDVLGTKGLALAIRDRLRRAAAGRVVNC